MIHLHIDPGISPLNCISFSASKLRGLPVRYHCVCSSKTSAPNIRPPYDKKFTKIGPSLGTTFFTLKKNVDMVCYESNCPNKSDFVLIIANHINCSEEYCALLDWHLDKAGEIKLHTGASIFSKSSLNLLMTCHILVSKT